MEHFNIIEKLLSNHGLLHVGENILSLLNANNLGQCRLVCTSWRNFIDNYRPWLILQLSYIHTHEKSYIDYSVKGSPKIKATIQNRFPEWTDFILQSSKTQCISRLKIIVKELWKYFKNESESKNKCPFHTAVAKSKVGFVQMLIDCGIDLEMKSPKGWTSLHMACMYSNIEMVAMLTKNMPTFNAKSRTIAGETIFHMAVENDDPRVLQLMLDTYRFENIKDENGWTILHTAAYCGPKNTLLLLLELLQKIGLNIDERTNKGGTVLHIACKYREIEIVDLVFNVLEKSNSAINFDTPDNWLEKPLHYACQNIDFDTAIQLLARNPERLNDLGRELGRIRWARWHVVHYACYYENLDLLRYVSENLKFDNFNVVDDNEMTPLHVACYFGKFEAAKFLLDKRVDIGKKAYQGLFTAEDLAEIKGHKGIKNLFNPPETDLGLDSIDLGQ